MLRKICPVCEQPMRLSHYCAGCRRFVKTPCMRDITYYLNESHPEGEVNCDYHKGSVGEKWPGAVDAGSGGKNSAGRRPDLSAARKKHGRSLKDKRIGILILAALILIKLTGAAVKAVGRFAEQPDYGDGGEYELLSVEEVRAQKTACRGNGHYSVSGEETDRQMEKIIRSSGYEVAAREVSYWNYRETGVEDPWSNYETTITYLLKKSHDGKQGTGSESVMIYYDTATEQLHGINLYVSEAEDAADMTEGILMFLREQGDIPGDQDYAASVKDDILKSTDGGQGDEPAVRREIPEKGEGRTEVYFSESDGEYYVHLWKTWY